MRLKRLFRSSRDNKRSLLQADEARMARFNPYEQYLNTDAETTDQLGMVILLYDAGIRYLREAKGAFERNDYITVGNALEKARAVVAELRATLNMEKGGDISQNLLKLYNFANQEILMTNAMREPNRIDGVIKVLVNLREGWQQLSKEMHRQDRVSANFSA